MAPSASRPIGIVGSGAVAQALGRALHERGARIAALTARDATRATHAAAFIAPDVRAVTPEVLVQMADRVIVAVSDQAIPAMAARLVDAGLRSGIVLHTCGSTGAEALAPLRAVEVRCGVLHPLQTIPSAEDGVQRLHGITYGIGGDAEAVAWAEQLARRLEGHPLRIAGGGFPAYHAAAALAGNAIAALLDAAVALMGRAGIDQPHAAEALAPLCRASLENVLARGADAALTGPVARGDAATVARHLRAVEDVPEIAELYRAMSRQLARIAARRGLDPAAVGRIGLLLDAEAGEEAS